MTLKTILMAGAVSLAMAGAANAAIIFSDNFNGETQGLNYSGFANFNVAPGGTVDLIGTGFYDFYPGNGNYVDLDGSTYQQGTLVTKASFGPGNYTLTFNLGGSARGDGDNSVVVSLGDFTTTLTLASNAGFTSQSFSFTTLSGGALSFASLSGNDNQGLILDNVSLSSGVPEPATWGMMLLGFCGLGVLAARRRRSARAVA